MKYTKGDAKFSLDEDKREFDYVKVRIQLDNEQFGVGGETPWAFKCKKTGNLFLANHAVALMPFPSWGMSIPSSSVNQEQADELYENRVLHPEAFEAYIENKVIDAEGNFLNPVGDEQKG